MKRMWSDMRYNRNLGHWFIMEEGQVSLIFSGEGFDLYVSEDRSFPCRLEYANRWTLIMGSMRFNLRTRDVYKIVV